MKQKLFTKSAFKIAINCQTQLYYSYKRDEYANQELEDDFLQSLAEGGFQVGELAKVYYGIPPKMDIEELDYDQSVERTKELFENENVNIAEAAFRHGNLFVRTDILEKIGNQINIIEVKAKSWDETTDSFYARGRDNEVSRGMIEYVYDVAFQKYVVTLALKELYPDKTFNVKAHLMMADKTKKADIDGINQRFKITSVRGRKRVVRADDADILRDAEHVLTAYDVDHLCDLIIEGKSMEQPLLLFQKFKEFVAEMADAYCNQKRLPSQVTDRCFKCPYRKTSKDPEHLKDGHKECWMDKAGFTEEDFNRPQVEELWGMFVSRGLLIDEGKYFLEDIEPGDIKEAAQPDSGMSHSDRKWLQIAMATNNKRKLKRFEHNIHNGVYLDKEGLREEMSQWKFPLHMIDFETTAVALPFYKGMRPYEQVAFQFSHHVISKNPNGTYHIEHKGQYINVEKGHFPNFDFVRALKKELENDGGSVFRYASHENSILNEIRKQLEQSDEKDKDVLMAFIDTITHRGHTKKDKWVGHRDMIDLLKVVKSYFYAPSMKGSNSIKVVLPAVLNASKYIQEKYSKPIYGAEIPSKTITPEEAIAWIERDETTGEVLNPYKLLPPVGSYIDIDQDNIDSMEDSLDETVANGGAALAAYSKLQFSDMASSAALEKALLRYCELDTMAMVFIWEYFNNEINN